MRLLMDRGTRLLLSAVLAIGVGFSSPSAVQASCNPHRGTTSDIIWMGTNRGLTGITGVQSSIRTYDPYISGSGGISYAWSMLAGTGQHQYMQIGPFKSAAGRSMTVQINNDWANPIQWDFAAPTVGSVHTYLVLAAPGNPTSKAAQYDTQIKISYNLPFTAKVGEVYAEIVNQANQLMGDATTKEYFNVNQVRNSAGTWSQITSAISPPTTHYGSSGTGYSFYVWDKCQ